MKNSDELYIEYLLYLINQAVKDFTGAFHPNHFLRREFKTERVEAVPRVIEMYISKGTITIDEGQNILKMIDSEDRTNWLIAFYTLLNLKYIKHDKITPIKDINVYNIGTDINTDI